MAILEVRGVNKRFGGLQALNDVNLSIEEGCIHAIIGPNGAGKSTLLKCFIGRLDPDSGSVVFDGKNLLGLKPCLLYTSPSPRDGLLSRMPSSA